MSTAQYREGEKRDKDRERERAREREGGRERDTEAEAETEKGREREIKREKAQCRASARVCCRLYNRERRVLRNFTQEAQTLMYVAIERQTSGKECSRRASAHKGLAQWECHSYRWVDVDGHRRTVFEVHVKPWLADVARVAVLCLFQVGELLVQHSPRPLGKVVHNGFRLLELGIVEQRPRREFVLHAFLAHKFGWGCR